MKIAILSDIHGNGAALDQVLEDCRKNQVEQYYFLGDYITDGPNINSIIRTIRQIGQIVLCGNKEEYMLAFHPEKSAPLQFKGHEYTYQRLGKEHLAYLATLPIAQEVTIEGVRMLLYHGLPEMARKVFHPMRDAEVAERLIREYDCDLYIGGHTHIPYECSVQDRLFANPGSVGLPMRTNGLCYGILEVQQGRYTYEQKILSYDRNKIRTKLLEGKQQYLDTVGIWSDLFLTSLTHNKDVTFEFLKLAYEVAGIEVTVGNTKGIDDESFVKAVQIWNQKMELGEISI